MNYSSKSVIIFLSILFTPMWAWAGDRYTYDGLSVGMTMVALQTTGYKNCQAQPDMGPSWVSCTNSKNFFPSFQGNSIDDVEVELPDGKTVRAINLITSADIDPNTLAKQVKGTVTDKQKLSLISVKNHEDSLMVMHGKVAILSNSRD